MPQLHADQNLLFGVLALQLNFVTPEALLGAMNAWALTKDKPLGALLRERQALSVEEHAELDRLLTLHVKRHGGDPERSLAQALGPRGEAFDALGRITDPELQESLRAATKTTERDADTDADRTLTRPPLDAEAGFTGRFRILRFHKEGGLGRVFIAFDRELNREVALKQIKDERAGEADQQRFVYEAEVTGRLEHPGVVPVYSLNHYDDGRPYYAMRFIGGDNLREAIEKHHRAADATRDTRRRELRALLERFIAVCDTVAYAHDRGMLHRDIKPANVMLGKFGETLLVDWGLAKAVGRPETPGARPSDEPTLRPSSGSDLNTMPGRAHGTLEYASPEQAAGALERLGPASDVYGLGATLYHLLAGRAAFDKKLTRDEVRDQVLAGDFAPPRRWNPEVPRPLEAVCLKAMALRPEARYASAQALGEDVRRWLADEPVSAYREPWPARAARWARRHRPAVAAAAALLVTAVVGLAVSNGLLREEQRATERQRRNADQQRIKARDNLLHTLDTIDVMLIKGAESYADATGQEDLRLDLATEAVRRVDGILASNPRDPSVRRYAAQINRHAANILRNLGRFPEALTKHVRAVALYDALLDETANNLALRDQTAEAHCDLSDCLIMNGRLDDSLPHLERAIALAEGLIDEEPKKTEYRRTVARGYTSRAEALIDAGRLDEARRAAERAVADAPKINDPGGAPTTMLDVLHAAFAQQAQADVARADGRPDDALRGYERALVALDLWEERHGSDLSLTQTRALLLKRRGELGARSTDPARRALAERDFTAACQALTDLRARYPKSRALRAALARVLAGRADVLGPERRAEAERDARQAVELTGAADARATVNPDDRAAQAQALAALGRLTRDRALLESAVACQERVLKSLPKSPVERAALARYQDDVKHLQDGN